MDESKWLFVIRDGWGWNTGYDKLFLLLSLTLSLSLTKSNTTLSQEELLDSKYKRYTG